MVSGRYGDDLSSYFYGRVEEMHDHWTRYLVLGIALIILGIVAIGAAPYATLASVVMIGAVLAIGGLAQIIHEFSERAGNALFLNVAMGVLYVVVGVLLIVHPAAGALSLTLLLGAFLLVAGLAKAIIAGAFRFSNRGWVLFNGIITFLLGISILAGWPLTGLWTIGLFLGIEMILNGWAWVALALAAHNPRLVAT